MNLSELKQFTPKLLAIFGDSGEKFDHADFQKLLKDSFKNDKIENIQQSISEDIEFFKKNDPASKKYSTEQILSIRRGMIAIATHRVMNKILDQEFESEETPKNILFEIEYIARRTQQATNVEIHPEASLGKSFAIDHGHGTVIGATTITGDNIFCYHGVTLGASGKQTKNGRRHPKLGNDIFLGNGSQILGPSVLENGINVSSNAMVINSHIGSNVSISPGVVVSGVTIPPQTKIFGFIPEKRKFLVELSEKNVPEEMNFPSFNIKDMEV